MGDVALRLITPVSLTGNVPGATTPLLHVPFTPSIQNSGVWLGIYFLAALFSQNVVAYVWFKCLAWTYLFPFLILISFGVSIIAAVLTVYNTFSLAQNLSNLFQISAKWPLWSMFIIF